jgi:DNA polymerase III alpha subunit
MKQDKFGQQIYNENELCNLYMSDPSLDIKEILVDNPINVDESLFLKKVPKFTLYNPLSDDMTIEDFDQIASNDWLMPDEYKKMDIAQYVLSQCDGEIELQRAGEELILYQERDMFMLLRYLKYLVDTMRANNILWGVGRGSSTSSFVLFLIGIHRINPIYWDLSINEFLR